MENREERINILRPRYFKQKNGEPLLKGWLIWPKEKVFFPPQGEVKTKTQDQ